MLRRSLALALPTLLAVASAAQPADDASAPELFVDVLDVNVVNVEVVVTYRDGDPVRGLTRDDFRLLEDGREVELSNFYAVESAQRVFPTEQAGATPPVLTELPADQRLHLAAVVDNLNISPANRKRVIDQLQGEVARVVRPGDEVMVGTVSPYPHVEQPFTGDMAAVSAALDRIGRSTAGNPSLDVLRRQIQDVISSEYVLGTGGGSLPYKGESPEQPQDSAQRALDLIRAYGDQAEYQVRQTYAGLSALIDSLSGLPGRKAVLFVSEGVQTRPVETLMLSWFEIFADYADEVGVFSPESESRRWDTGDEMMDLARLASASQVTFYTLNAAGLPSGGAGPDVAHLQPAGAALDVSAQDAILQLAAATGGSAMLNPAAVAKLLDRMASDYSDYYSLGYVSPYSRDGELHRIEVRVPDHDGVRVRHQEAYRARTTEQEMMDRTVSALVLDVADNPLEVRIELGAEQQEGKKNQWVLPVLVKVPIAKLALVPQQREHRGKLSIWVAVRDDEGRTSAPQHFELPVDVPNEQLLSAMSRDVGYGVNLLVRGGESKLAVGVRDEIGAITSTVNLNISIGEG